MEKNVGSVDIDELKKAREELNQMRGIETDPNMYSNYNPNRNEESKAEEVSHSDEESLTSESYDDFDEINENSSTEDSNESSGEMLDEFLNENAINEEAVETSLTEENSQDDDKIENDFSNTEQNDSANGTIKNIDEQPSEKDFSVYDNFSAFEVKEDNIKPEQSSISVSDKVEEAIVDETPIDGFENDNNSSEDSTSPEIKTNGVYLIDVDTNQSDDAENALNNEVDYVQNENNQIEDNIESEEVNPDNDSLSIKENSEKTENESIDNDEQVDFDADSLLQDEILSDVSDSESDEDNTDLTELLIDGKLGEFLSSEENESENSKTEIENEQIVVSENNQEIEDDSDTKSLKERIDELKDSNEIESSIDTNKVDEEKNNYLPKIDDFKYVDIISQEEFKENGKLTFLLGRNEENNNIYLNLKDSLNIGIFGSFENENCKLLNSILLSLMLKNSSDELNIAICDSVNESKLKSFENCDYMMFNRASKTQREIYEAFSQLSEELEDRYSKLGLINAKSIDDYNELVDSNNKMPYIILVYNNYSNVASNEYYVEINSLLYQILKLGRLVGIYVLISSENSIDNVHVSYNLPTRISFKTENKDDSISKLGISGAESLSENDEVLWVSIADERCVHIKVPNLSLSEIKVIMENLEK